MAEFKEVINQWMRRCEACDRNEKVKCGINGHICDGFYKMQKYINPEFVEQDVMAWAAKHPNPVYPTVDAIPVVHGRWGENGDCSECGFQPWYERDIHTLSYCPNCGAKMDGERIDAIDNPLAWALYQTWRHVDEPPKEG